MLSRLGSIGGRLYRGDVSVDFVGRKKLWYLISGAILLVSIAALGIRGLNYSVEFNGGSVYQFSAPAATQAQVSSVVVKAGGGQDTTVQAVHGTGQTQWQVQTHKLSYAQSAKIRARIASAFGLRPTAVSVQYVGPSWGTQISQKALQALIAFLIVIVIYLSIAFEWRMASAALVALVHDIVITIGVYALTGFHVSPATVIGLLTILGYSLYDTVVVFDKVRENTAGLLSTRRSSYSEAANLALNQTLVRSINTSLIALLPVVSILLVAINLLGSNNELKDLSLVLFVGMLSGTYSSICIATPVLADLKERQPDFRQLAKQIAQRGASVKRKAKVPVGGPAGQVADGAVTAEPAAGETAADREAAGESSAGEATGVAAGPPAAARPARPPGSGQRQQPRRPNAARRRPAGKKKRR